MGQSRPSGPMQGMSAKRPIADIWRPTGNVAEVPEAVPRLRKKATPFPSRATTGFDIFSLDDPRKQIEKYFAFPIRKRGHDPVVSGAEDRA